MSWFSPAATSASPQAPSSSRRSCRAQVSAGLRCSRCRRCSVGLSGPHDGQDSWRAFRLLSVAVICRSAVALGLSTFLALFIEQELHAGTGAGEAALALLFLTGAAGTLLGGRLARRRGRSARSAWPTPSPCPPWPGSWAPGYTVYAFIAAVGLASYVPFSLHVTLGQDYLPGHIGTASGVTLGLSVSIGGLAAPLIGSLAQATSLQAALTALLIAPAVAWVVSRRLPEPRNAVRRRGGAVRRERGFTALPTLADAPARHAQPQPDQRHHPDRREQCKR